MKDELKACQGDKEVMLVACGYAVKHYVHKEKFINACDIAKNNEKNDPINKFIQGRQIFFDSFSQANPLEGVKNSQIDEFLKILVKV